MTSYGVQSRVEARHPLLPGIQASFSLSQRSSLILAAPPPALLKNRDDLHLRTCQHFASSHSICSKAAIPHPTTLHQVTLRTRPDIDRVSPPIFILTNSHSVNLSSTHSLLHQPPARSSMDSPNASTMDTNGKAAQSNNIGFRPSNQAGPLIKVEPPRREDLQPSYAQTLQGENEAEMHGWYGSMSMSAPPQALENVRVY